MVTALLKEFNVILVCTSTVHSLLPAKDSCLKASNIDLTIPAISPGHFFVYKAAKDKRYGDVVNSIKKALSETLILFYPAAGRFVMTGNGEAEIECNNQGVPFMEAEADALIKNIDFSQPSLSVGWKLSPTREPLSGESPHCLPVLAVQVTRMKCGGLVVGCSFDHRIVDGISSSIFFKAWTESAQGRSFSVTPCFHGSLINPRRSLNITANIDSHYIAIPFSSVNASKKQPQQIGRIYHLDALTLLKLQSLANQTRPDLKGGKPNTKMEAVSAYIWRLVARTQALSSSKPTRIGIPIDGRTYLNLPPFYFGNAIAIPFVETYAEEILDKPLGKTAEMVRNVITTSANSEYFNSFVDWVEGKRPSAMLARVYAEAGSASAVVVSSGMRIPLYEIDVGCGKPAFSSVYFPWGGTAGYVMLQASPLGEGNMVVYMHMAEKDLDAIETDPDFIFVKANKMNFW